MRKILNKRLFFDFRKNLILLIVLSAGIILTFSIFIIIKNQNHYEMRERFMNYAISRYVLLTNQFDRYFLEAEVVGNFYRSSQLFEKKEFKSFVYPLLSQKGDSGAGFLWIPYIKKEGRKNLESILKKESGIEPTIWEFGPGRKKIISPEKDFYLPVQLLEPEKDFGSLIGMDLSSDSLTLKSVEKLIKTKAEREIDVKGYLAPDGKMAAIRVFVPIYNSVLKGFVMAWYSTTRQFKSLLGKVPSSEINFDVWVNDNKGTKQILYSSYTSGSNKLSFFERLFNDDYELNYSNAFSKNEIEINFEFKGSADFVRNNTSYAHWALLAFGMALNILLFAITYRLLYRKERAEELVLERTQRMRESERTAHVLLNASPEVIVLADLEGKIIACNERCIYSIMENETEILGKNYFDLIGKAIAAKRKIYFDAAVNSGSAIHFEDEVDGIWNECGLFPIPDEFGKIAKVALFSHDITTRKNNERIGKEYSKRIEKISDLQRLIILYHNPDIIYRYFINALDDFYSPDVISIAIFDADNKYVKMFNKRMDSPQAEIETEIVPYNDFTAIGLHQASGTVIKNNSPAPSNTSAYWDKHFSRGITSFTSIPLQTRDSITGRLTLMSKKQSAFSIGNVAFAQDVAATLAIALEQYSLLEQNKLYAADLEKKVDERTFQLEQTNKELEAFSYSVSHDLRAPLRAIDGYSRVIYEDFKDALDDTAKTYLEKILSSTGKMATLIEDLLKLSRISKIAINKEQFNLSELIEEIIDELKCNSPERKVSVEIERGHIVTGDYRLLKIAMENLLGNAWKFTRKKEEAVIKFGLLEVDKEKYYFISDNGAGFDMQFSNRLFGAFQRLHNASDFPGTGIGLSIVHRIITRHNGKIKAESKPDTGTTFYFTFS